MKTTKQRLLTIALSALTQAGCVVPVQFQAWVSRDKQTANGQVKEAINTTLASLRLMPLSGKLLIHSDGKTKTLAVICHWGDWDRMGIVSTAVYNELSRTWLDSLIAEGEAMGSVEPTDVAFSL